MFTLSRAALCLSLVAFALACGGDDDKPADAGAAPTVTARDTIDATRICESTCARAVDCSFFPSTDACLPSCVAGNEAALADSGCTFSAEDISACAQAWEEQTCDDFKKSVVPAVCSKTCDL
jgi:hypothetical protein